MDIFFLYLPILYIITFSFNQSPIPGKWEGFSLKWYYALLSNEGILRALLTSLEIASISATCALVLGTMAAMTMVRFSYFKGKKSFIKLVAYSPYYARGYYGVFPASYVCNI